MAKKTSIKVRLVPESKPNSPFFYYVRKPSSGEKAKIKLKVKKYNPATRKHETFIEKKLALAIMQLDGEAFFIKKMDIRMTISQVTYLQKVNTLKLTLLLIE